MFENSDLYNTFCEIAYQILFYFIIDFFTLFVTISRRFLAETVDELPIVGSICTVFINMKKKLFFKYIFCADHNRQQYIGKQNFKYAQKLKGNINGEISNICNKIKEKSCYN